MARRTTATAEKFGFENFEIEQPEAYRGPQQAAAKPAPRVVRRVVEQEATLEGGLFQCLTNVVRGKDFFRVGEVAEFTGAEAESLRDSLMRVAEDPETGEYYEVATVRSPRTVVRPQRAPAKPAKPSRKAAAPRRAKK